MQFFVLHMYTRTDGNINPLDEMDLIYGEQDNELSLR